MAKRKEKDYGPDLTDSMRKELEKEIKAFDEKKTLRELETASEHRPSVTYETMDPLELLVSREESEPGQPTSLDKDVEMAKIEIDELLSHRQRQAWRLCMRQGKTQEEAADILHIRRGAIDSYLKAAEIKIRKHFERKNNV
jgi:DNA-directed RNA polymerase specialized sigma24 family protein